MRRTVRHVATAVENGARAADTQLRSALSSVALNLSEGNQNQGGNRIARFSTAAGSNAESRTALKVAVAWGYVEALDIEAGDALLDQVAAMLHRLGARR